MGLSSELFQYDLPEELIAQRPAEKRDMSRMMAFNRQTGETDIGLFPRIVSYLEPGDALIFNDTKVMRARMFGRRDGRPDGALFEILLVAVLDRPERWNALLKPGKRAKVGTRVVLTGPDGVLTQDADWFEVDDHCEDGSYLVHFSTDRIEELQQQYGHIPLPPYIQRGDENADAERYQTIFAKDPGAVAAPTAGLHFTPEIMEQIRQKGVQTAAITLHVGPGTFKPVSVSDVTQHHMHTEQFILSPETAELINRTHAAGKKVLAVGTTTVRVLESCADADGTVHPRHGSTDIFLYPPYRPKAVDMLLTNFHLPKSTLLMLISTFADREKILAAYQQAIQAKMRFYSYGDCMLFY